jgi:hypothetical protein
MMAINDCYPIDHPEIKRRLEILKRVGFKRIYALTILYFAAVFINGFLIIIVVNSLYKFETFPTILAAIIYLIVTVFDFTLLYHNKITPAILTLVIIFAWILLPYQFISGKTILDKNKTPIEIKKGIFHRRYPLI